MAAAQKSTTAPAPAVVFGTGKFTFVPTKAETIPVTAAARPERARLWFEDFFKHAFRTGKAEDAHGENVFVPNSYWTAPKAEGGRELGPQKPDQLRTKYRDSFKRWQKEVTENPETTKALATEVEKLQLLLIPRKEGQENGKETFPEEGFSLFLVDKTRN